MVHRISVWTTLFIWIVSALAEVPIEKNDACSGWKLSGEGNENFEGFIEVNYQGEWVNVCEVSLHSAQLTCLRVLPLGHMFDYTKYTTGKVFNDSLRNKAISSIEDCDQEVKVKRTCYENNTTDCCQPAWICCLDLTKHMQCSASWQNTSEVPCYISYGEMFTYSQVRAGKLIQRMKYQRPLFWTKSALVKLIPTDDSTKNRNCSLGKDVLRKCSNKCLNRVNVTTISVGLNGMCECFGRPHQYYTECYNELNITDKITEPDTVKPILCIAAKITGGRVTLFAEDCEEFLQPLCLRRLSRTTTLSPTQMEGANTTSPTRTQMEGAISCDDKASSDTSAFIGVGVGTCVFTLIVVGSVYLLTRHIRRRRKHTNTGREGYMTNIERDRSNISGEVNERRDGQINLTS